MDVLVQLAIFLIKTSLHHSLPNEFRSIVKLFTDFCANENHGEIHLFFLSSQLASKKKAETRTEMKFASFLSKLFYKNFKLFEQKMNLFGQRATSHL